MEKKSLIRFNQTSVSTNIPYIFCSLYLIDIIYVSGDFFSLKDLSFDYLFTNLQSKCLHEFHLEMF